MTENQKLMLIFSCILGCVLVVVWLSLVDLSQILTLFKKVKLIWLLATSVFCTGQWFSRSMRWRVILRPVSKISIFEAFTLYMTGTFLNFLIPVRAGEITKSICLRRLNATPVSKSLPTVFIDKVIDLSPIALVLAITPFIRAHLSKLIYTILLSLFLIFTVFIFVIIFSVARADIVTAIMRKSFFWLPKFIKKKIITFLEHFIEGMSVIRVISRKIVSVSAFTLMTIIFDSFFVWTFFYAFGLKIPWLVILFCATLIPLFYVLPSPPAAIGSHELIFITLFSVTFGYDTNIASAVALSAHLLTLFLLGIFGFISFGYFGLEFSAIFGSRRKLKESEG